MNNEHKNNQIMNREDLAGSPLQIELRFRTPLSPKEAFNLVLFQVPQWFTQIHKVNWDHSRSKNGTSVIGACSERECSIGNKVLKEEIVAFEQDRTYSYRADLNRSTMKMPIKNHLGTFTVEEKEGGGSILTWKQHFQAPVWPLGAMVRWYMRDRMMKPAIKTLIKKYGGEIC